MEKIRASRLVLSQILGIGSIEILPGDVTIIEGKNAAGKTSILDGFKSVLQGGKDATLKRVGAAKGEAVIEFSNHHIARRTVDDTKKGGDLEYIHPEYGPLRGPQGILDKMLDAIALDPAKLINATDEERLACITEALQVELTDERIAEEGGLPLDLVRDITSQTAGLHALDLVNHVRKSVGAIRLQHNRTLKEKTGALESLRPTLSGVDTSVDWAAEERIQRDLISSLRSDLNLRMKAAEGNCKRIESNAAQAYLEARTQKRRECDDRIKAIEREFEEDCQREMAARDLKVNDARLFAAQLIATDREELDPKLETAVAAATEAAGKADTVRRELHSIALLEQFETELADAKTSSESLTVAISKLDTLKGNLLEGVDIPNLEITDGVVMVGGVPFRRLNTQAKLAVCIEIAKLRSRRAGLGVVIIDNLECLDDEHLEAFVQQALNTELQWIIGRVCNKPGVNVRVVNAADRRAA